MTRNKVVFTQSFSLFIIAAVAATGIPKPSVIGMNWGKQGWQYLLPSMVVDLLLENGIHKIKLFAAQDTMLDALSDSGIEVTTMMPNFLLPHINNSNEVREWVREGILPYLKNVKFKYLIVGNNPFSLQFPMKDYPYKRHVLIHKYAQDAVNGLGIGDKIKVATCHTTDILKSGIHKPSDAVFRDDVIAPMGEIIRQLKANGAPLMLNIRPMAMLLEYNWPFEFVFFDGTSGFTIVDGDITYTNMFDVIYDAVVCAVERAGGKGIEIVVSQVGWPTDGGKEFNIRNAERFYKGLLNKLAKNVGTPRRPGPIEAFAYNLLDENKLAVSPGRESLRHWGIYLADGHPKFKIDFSGQGRDIIPEVVPGLTYMPERWCVFNGNTTNMTLVNQNFQMACNESDCTSLAFGASCGNLDFNGNISYAFNMYFQTKRVRQDEELCNFQGLGVITMKNASVGQCLFPLQIVSNFTSRVTEIPGAAIWVIFSVVFMLLFQ